ncbi:MAG: glutamyl-tRNA reductase [Acidobacteria bacterium]|nr:MAG: glutamyl-tRNA reductase [Acidobacteriota bacterium]
MIRTDRTVVVAGFDWRSAGHDALARLHALRRRTPDLPHSGATPIVTVATCHRIEVYAEGLAPAACSRLLVAQCVGDARAPLPGIPAPRVLVGEDAVRHLLRVAAGLESVVVGEDQVLVQLRRAYRAASAAGLTGPSLHRAFHAAFRAGRRVRAETALGRGSRSIAGAAVNALQRELGDLGGRAALVVGTGETAALLARRLRQRGVRRLMIAGRSPAKAEAVAGRLGGEAIAWPWRAAALRQVDVVAAATSAPEPSIRAWMLRAVSDDGDRVPWIVDLGMPPDVERCDGAPWAGRLIDLPGLARRIDRERALEAEAAGHAHRIVEQELAAWRAWRSHRAMRRALWAG